MHCKARHGLHDLFSTNLVNGSKMTYVHELLKSTSKI